MKTLNRIKSKKKFKITFDGQPDNALSVIPTPNEVGLSPVNYKFIKAKVIVKVGDAVQKGQALFFDKKNPQVYFHSPVSGVVKDIVYGPQRRLEQVVISECSDEKALQFQAFDSSNATQLQVVSALLERGLFNEFRSRPFNNIPSPEEKPSSIIVQLSNPEPFHARLSAVIDDVEADIIEGLQLLNKLTEKVIAFADANEQMNLDAIATHSQLVRVDGDFSICDSASVLYKLKEDAAENNAWTCDWQSLVKIARTLKSNEYYNQRYIAVGGNQKDDNQHYQIVEGTPVANIITKKESSDRLIFGGLFSGVHTSHNDYVPLQSDSINIIDSDPQAEFMSFLQPGFDKPSFTTAYFSGFLNQFRPTPVSTSVNGSERDCVSCGHCEAVCPVDTLPQTMLRNIKGNDVEEAMRFGLLDCSNCGVCTYVCPSKIDLSSIFADAKAKLFEEVNA
ncbi:MAG: 4Fe-4S dicluster domain-containing protein [Candidatus Marinamargulisbacteria bacterium]